MEKLALAVVLSGLIPVPLSGCSSKSADEPTAEVANVAQGPSAYDKYKQEISGLSQIGVNTRNIEDGGDKAAFVVAVEDWPAYLSATQKLEASIKTDAGLEGTETTGQKAELLAALRIEGRDNSPRNRAYPINKKTGEKIFQQFSIYGREALKNPAVSAAAIAYIGYDGISKFHGYSDTVIGDEAQRAFVNSPLTASR